MLALLALTCLPAGSRISVQIEYGTPAPSTVEAREYRTEFARYVFQIDRSDGAARSTHCRLLENGRLCWEREFPWTFSEVSLAADGTVVGYSNGSALHIVTIDSRGNVRRDHRIAVSSWNPAGFPRAIGPVLVQPLTGVAWLRISPEAEAWNCPDPWRVIRLADGEFERDDIVVDHPIPMIDGQRARLIDARVIGDSGLTLLDWRISDYRRIDFPWVKFGTAFSLVDQEGRTVWSLVLSGDHSDARSEDLNSLLGDDLYLEHMIYSVGPGNRFSIRHVQSGVRVAYELARDVNSASGWRASERGTVPYCGGAPWTDLRTTRTLPEPKRIPLRLPSDDAAFERDRAVVTIDRQGRVLVTDSATGSIHVFDPSGTEVPRGTDLRDGRADDESMRVLESRDQSGGHIPLDCITARAILPGVQLAVLRTRLGPTLCPQVYTYSPGGRPDTCILLPVGPEYDWMSTSNRWIAAGGVGSKFALVRLADRSVQVCDPSLGDLHDWRCGQTPDGRVILFVNTRTLELVRYELP